jgi:putative FmdB family regulatory protein
VALPIYEYSCNSCGHKFDTLQKMTDPSPPCPKCGEEVRKLVSAAAFVLKGGGWYKDHYGLKGSAGGSTSEGGSSGDAAAPSAAPAAPAPAATPAPASTPTSTPSSGS